MEMRRSDVFCDCGLELQQTFSDIPGSGQWTGIKVIRQGDSADLKFRVKDSNGNRFLLRLADRTRYDHVRSACRILELLHQNNVPVSAPAGFGLCGRNSYVYLLTSWVYGKPAQERLPQHHKVIRYLLGQETAVYLYALHSCTAPTGPEQWAQQTRQRIDNALTACRGRDREPVCVRRLQQFVLDNCQVAAQQPQSVLHGDLTPANLIFSYEQSVGLIDFEKWHFGDPLADLAPVMTDFFRISTCFATGLLDSYFHYRVETRSFRRLAFYAALRMLQQYAAACAGDEAARQLVIEDIRQVVKEYNGFSSVVPAWYREMPRIE